MGPNRYDLFGLLALTTIVAFLVAFNLYPYAIAFALVAVLPGVLMRLLIAAIHRLQYSAATRLAGLFFSQPAFFWVPLVCGRSYAAVALSNHSSKLYEGQEYELAESALCRALELDRRYGEFWASRGICRYQLGRHDEALTDLTVALRIKPDLKHALVARGYAHMELGDRSAALRDLSLVECVESRDAHVAFFRGALFEHACAWQAAMDNFSLAYRLDPAKTDAAISLARLQAGCPDERFRDGAKAFQNATAICVRTAWRDWIAISILASACAEQGDFVTAIKYAQNALELAPAEEQPTRQARIEQYRNRIPFRIPMLDEPIESKVLEPDAPPS